ncbi:hypothetical protein GOODEAATRI_030842, partial [Goodea atripinnis]
IIHFLRTRAHPVLLTQTPVLPPTITDQIRLWELERDRLQFTEGECGYPTRQDTVKPLLPGLWPAPIYLALFVAVWITGLSGPVLAFLVPAQQQVPLGLSGDEM